MKTSGYICRFYCLAFKGIYFPTLNLLSDAEILEDIS